jgi:2,3-bisphosphoglycerate-dependent phosphoglycerate mutase
VLSSARHGTMDNGTTIYLIRHAHATWRQDESRPLSEAGIKAAAKIADRLSSRPIGAVYTSPSMRSVETVEPLATRLGLRPEPILDLRERELPVVPPGEFDDLVRRAWSKPDEAPGGGESNVRAQARGLAVVQTILARHVGSQVVVGTHGNLLALVMNALDSRFAHDFWRELSFPDIYELEFDGPKFRGVERLWDTA